MSIKSLFLIGNKISHSLSYRIYNVLFKKYSLPMIYSNLDLDKDYSQRFVELIPGIDNLLGMNATYPYKKLLKRAGTPDEKTIDIGGANILYKKDRGLFVSNTDGQGIVRAIMRNKIKAKKVALLGTGITSRAIAHELYKDVKKLVVYTRDIRKINNKAFFSEKGIVLDEYMNINKNNFDVIFNVTPVSFDMLDLKEKINCGKLFDVNYNNGSYCDFNGIYLLVEQALINFRIWTGIDADSDYDYLFELLTGEN